MDDILSTTFIWPPVLFLSFLSQPLSVPGAIGVSAVLTLLAGIVLAVLRREPAAWVVAPSVVLTHMFYFLMTLAHAVLTWPGVPLMFALDALLALLQLMLIGSAVWRARKSRLTPLLVGWFGLIYAVPFALYAYLNTYYVGM